MTNTERSWMDIVIEGGAADLNVGASAEADTATRLPIRNAHNPVGEAVDGLIDHASIFGEGELDGFVNEAIQNDCGELRQEDFRAQTTATSWDHYADSVRAGQIPEDGRRATADEAVSNAAAALAASEPRYAEGRRLLAEAVVQIRNEKKVHLSSTTWEHLTELDTDGYFSESLGFPVDEGLTEARERDGAQPVSAASRAAMPSNLGVDFARDVDETSGHSLEVAQMEQDIEDSVVVSMDAEADAAVARERSLELAREPKPLKHELAEGATVFNDAWRDANKRRIAEAAAAAEKTSAEPEPADIELG